MNVAMPDGNMVAIPDGVSQKDINDILNTYVNSQLQTSHGATPPASSVPYDEGMPKRIARGALKVAGGVGGGILATPETFGTGTVPAAMVGYSVGKKAGDVLFGEEPPSAPPAPRQATSMLGSMAEGVQRLPESLPRTAEGLMTFPAQAAESITTPLAKGDVVGAGKAAVGIPVGIAEFMAAPTGLMGLEKAKDVWAQDFAGSALGLAGAAKIGTGAVKGGAEIAKDVGQYAGNIPENLYLSALKPRTGKKGLSPEDRQAVADMAMKNDIVINRKGAGLDKVLDMLDKTNRDIESVITAGEKRNQTIPVDLIANRLTELRKNAALDLDPDAVAAIDTVEQQLRTHPKVKNISVVYEDGKPKAVGGELSVQDAQDLKRRIYTTLRKHYGEKKSDEIEARKNVARGIKEELNNTFPELKELNATDSTQIKLEQALYDATRRIQNRDIIGIGGPIKIGAGVATGKPGAIVGAAAAILDMPSVKSQLAIALYKARSRVRRLSNDQRGMAGKDINAPSPITPQIRRWFGDSKVVDESGNPLLVYHGTNNQFTKFDRERTPGGLVWFTADKSSIERGESGAAGTKFIMPAYLKVKKMAGWDEYDKYTLDQLIQQGYDGIKLDDDYVVFDNKQVKLIKDMKPTPPEEYRGTHEAPMKDSGAPLYDLKGIYPDDV